MITEYLKNLYKKIYIFHNLYLKNKVHIKKNFYAQNKEDVFVLNYFKKKVKAFM